MREGIIVDADRERLAAVVADRNSPQKHVWRARIILATAEGCGMAEIMRRAGVSKPCVWRWQERFMREGVAGLLRDKTRKPGLPPLPPAQIARVVELTLAEPPGAATHWTGRAMAAATGISLRSVQRIWAAHGLQPAEGSKRSPNRIANCPIAVVHSTGLRHLMPALRIARNRSFSAASSVGKLPRVLMILRRLRCRLSTAFVV